MNKGILRVIVVFSLLATLASAQDSIKTTFMFWSRMTMGQVVSSTILDRSMATYDIPFAKEWLESFDGGMKVTRELSPTLRGRFNLGAMVNAATLAPKTYTPEYGAKKVVPLLLDATLEYRRSGLFMHDDSFTAEFGYFPFKYNPQSTDLGEYLFRSGTYPGWLVTGFEQSIDRPKLAGAHLSHVFGSTIQLKQDLIVNTELEMYPYHDINVTYIATPLLGRIANFGFGVQLARLIAVDPPKTTIGKDSRYHNKAKPLYEPRIGYIDTTSNDTILYTFRGAKLMGRFSVDFREIFGGEDNDFLGKEDLKLYGEAALLGVKNYPGWYNNPLERIPMMAGFNWPTNQLVSYSIIPAVMAYLLEPRQSQKNLKTGAFGAAGVVTGVGTWFMDQIFGTNSKLDLISIEAEYNPSPYANDPSNIWKESSAVPYVVGSPSGLQIPTYDIDWNDSLSRADDGVKWSIYIAKMLGTRLRFSAQAACDHTPKSAYTPWPAASSRYNEVTPKPEDWYFMMRMAMYF